MGVEMLEAARRMMVASLPADLSDTDRKCLLFERLYGQPLPFRPTPFRCIPPPAFIRVPWRVQAKFHSGTA
jgi:hypothetical protein